MTSRDQKRVIESLLSSMGLEPVLIDVGASEGPPRIWESLAARSIYVGFDPDRRDLSELPVGTFQKSFIVNEAVSSGSDEEEVAFYLTNSPNCSSTLPPDTASLSDYLFAEKFKVESRVTAKATRLTEIAKRLSLDRFDWLKTDSQGTDLRIFLSIEPVLRSKILAVDLEPGLIDAYLGEDLFVDVHPAMVREGFWLSDCNVKGAVRARPTDRLAEKLGPSALGSVVRPSPGWVEVRYLRTLKFLADTDAQAADYVLLWVFSILDGQLGFAADIATEYAKLFGDDDISSVLSKFPLDAIAGALRQPRPFLARAARKAARILGRLENL